MKISDILIQAEETVSSAVKFLEMIAVDDD